MNGGLDRFLAEGALAGGRFAFQPPRRPPGGAAGSHLGRGAGESLEFHDHRPYQPGDDLRRVDWAAYGRSDRLTLKLSRQESWPPVDLVRDGSASRARAGTEKARAAAGLAAALAAAAGNAGFSHEAHLAGEACRPLHDGRADPRRWRGLEFIGSGGLLASFRRGAPRWRPRGVRVLIADLLTDDEPAAVLALLSRAAASVVIVQLLAAADARPEPLGPVRLVDCENGRTREIALDAATAARYQAALARHQERWSRAAGAAGAVFVRLLAEELVERWDLGPLLAAQVLRGA